MASPPHIGTLRERPLHASLKEWCAEPGDQLEVKVDRYVIDLVRGDLLIEIQTRGFASMKKKLHRLLEQERRVLVVYPIPTTKRIVRLDEDGEILGKRKSPKRGSLLDVFAELVSFPHLIAHPGFSLRLVLIEEDEYRKREENKAWRRHGWVVQERRLVEVVETWDVASPADLVALLPALPDTFTTADLASAAECPRRLAQQATYCLRNMGAAEIVGNEGRAHLYKLT